MSDLVLLEKQKDGSVREHAISGALKLHVDAGAAYSIVDKDTAHEPTDLVVKHVGHDLQILQGDHLIADIENFYGQGSDASFSVETPAGEMLTFQSSDPATVIADDGIVWQAETTVASADPSSGFHLPGWVAPALVGAIGVAETGGGGESSGPITAPPAVGQSTLDLGAFAGNVFSTVQVDVYASNGNLLSSTQQNFSGGQVAVSFDGSYSGPVIVKISDINGTQPDYYDEATGTNESLGSMSLRAMVDVTPGSTVNVTVSPLTELAVELAGVGSNNAVTSADVAENAHVAALFGLGDILGPVTTVNSTNYSASTSGSDPAEQYGNVLAMLSGTDGVTGSTAATLAQLSTLITTNPDGTLSLTSAGSALLSQGVEDFQAGPNGGIVNLANFLAASLNIITTPTETLSGVHLSADSGVSATDFITNVPAQTITATLSSPLLSGQSLMASLDGGTTFTDITGSVGTGTQNTTVSWNTTLLSGTNAIEFRVVDTMGNTGPTTTQTYTLDTTAPTTTLSGIALSNDSGTSASDFITNIPAQTVTATLSAPLATGDVLQASVDGGTTFTNATASVGTGTQNTTLSWSTTLASGTNTIEFRVMDAAGNIGPATTQAYTVDTTAPTTTVSGIAISNDSGASASDFITNVPTQTVTATLSAPLASGEVLQASVNGGATFTDVTGSVGTGTQNTTVNWSTTLASGANAIEFRVMNTPGNTGPMATQNYTLDTTAPTTTVSGIALSNDSGVSASDLITNVTAQTITATLSAPLAGTETLLASLNGGATFTDVTADVGTGSQNTTVSLNATLSGTSGTTTTGTIEFVVQDAAGNRGTTATQTYTVDMNPPTTTVSGIALSNDTGVSASDFLTNAPTQTITATLSAPLASGEVLQASVDGGATWANATASVGTGTQNTTVNWNTTLAAGANMIEFRVMDAAGNLAATASQTYTLDTVAPSTTVSGIAISNDTGASASDFITKTPTQTVTATLSAPLAGTETLLASVNGGTTFTNVTTNVSGTSVSWSTTLAGATGTTTTGTIEFVVQDAAGNLGATATQAYTLDMSAPTTTVGGLALSNDTGVSSSDFITNQASQTITGTLSVALTAGEILMGSVDGGTTFTDITSSVSGTSVAWNTVLAGGTNTIEFEVQDAAGNIGTTTTRSYTLDTVPPTTTLSGIALLNDTGVSASDFITSAPTQTVTATLSATLAGTETLLASVNSGTTFTDITASVTGTNVSWVTTLAGATGTTSTGTIEFVVQDAAGNRGTTATQTYTVDMNAPTTTVSGIALSHDTGVSSSDFITNQASQTITATLSTALASGEVLMASVDGGTTFTNITSSVSGTSVSWATTLTGASGTTSTNTIVFEVQDAAGNAAPTAMQIYSLDQSAPTLTGAKVDAAGQILLTAGADVYPATFNASDFSVKVNGSPYAIAGATVTTSGAVVLSGATGDIYQGDVITSVAYKATGSFIQDVAGNGALAATFTNLSNSAVGFRDIINLTYSAMSSFEVVQNGGSGYDLLSINVHTTRNAAFDHMHGLSVDQNGYGGGDIMAIQFTDSQLGGSTTSAVISANEIAQVGGSGSDSMAVSLSAYEHSATRDAATINSNSLSIDGGGGNDTMNVAMTARVSAAAGTDLANIDANDIAAFGGTGSDAVSVTLKAMAVNTTVVHSIYPYADAGVASNTISVGGGAGGDAISVSLYADEVGKGGTASVAHNQLDLAGGAGSNSLQAQLTASAFDTETSAFVNSFAAVSGNSVQMSGGGNDLMSVDMHAKAHQVHASARMTSNQVSLMGGAGSNSMWAALTASAAGSRSAGAQVSGNDLQIHGGAGNDHGVTGTNPITVDLTAHAKATGAGYTSMTTTTTTSKSTVVNTLSTNVNSTYLTVPGLAPAGPTTLSMSTSRVTTVVSTTYNKSTVVSTHTNYNSHINTVLPNGQAAVKGNAVAFVGFAGNDAIAVNLAAVATGAKHASATNDFNTIHLDGGAGTDSLSARLVATAVTTATAATGTSAHVAHNQVRLDGGSGNDTLALSAAANDVVSNLFYVVGGSGNDSVAVDVVGGKATASGMVAQNDIHILGGSGSDTLTLQIGKTTAPGRVGSNHAAIFGGAGADNISAAYTASTAVSNKLVIRGGAGADAIHVAPVMGEQVMLQYAGANEFGDTISGLSAADNVSVVLASGLNTGSFTYNTTAFDLVHHTTGGGSAVVASFTQNVGLTAGDIHFTKAMGSNIAMKASSLGTSNVVQDGGSGSDALSLDLSGLFIGGLFIAQDGGAGADSLNALLQASTVSGATNATVNTNDVVLTGGAGNDTIVATMVAHVGHATSNAAARVTGNSLSVEAGAGSDSVSVRETATAGSSAMVPKYAHATVSNNDIWVTGTGHDAVTVSMAAQAVVGSTGDAKLGANTIQLNGGGGTDLLHLNMRVTVAGFSAASFPTPPAASIVANQVTMAGGGGSDTLAVNMAALGGNSTSIAANVKSNTIDLAGGSGVDALGVNLKAAAYAQYGAFANVANNTMSLAGGTGADHVTATLSANANFLAEGSALVKSNTIDANGGSGSDVLSMALNARAAGNGLAAITHNLLALDGGSGNDSIDATLSARQTGTTAFHNALIKSNAITVSGGPGQDNVALRLSASSRGSRPTAHATMSHNNIVVDAGGSADTISVNLVASNHAHSVTTTSAMSWNLKDAYDRVLTNNIQVAGGTGNDVVTANLSAFASGSTYGKVSVSHNQVHLSGGQGSDSLAVNVRGEGMGTGSATVEMYANVISLDGGSGNDSLAVEMHATDAGGYRGEATIRGNTVSLAGGAGSDLMSVVMSASAHTSTASASYVDAYVENNVVSVDAGSGNDHVTVDLMARGIYTGSTSTLQPRFAKVSNTHNAVAVTGGTGNDTIAIDLGAQAAALGVFSSFNTMHAYVSHDTIVATGGTGTDLLTVTMTAGARAVSTYDIALVRTNTVTLSGGAGNDTVRLDMTVTAAAASRAYATEIANHIALSGGSGADALWLGMKATVSGDYAQNVHNNIMLSGGGGNDVITADLQAKLIAPGNATYSNFQADFYNDTVSATGGSGSDTLVLDMSAVASGNAEAYFGRNALAAHGGGGVDSVAVNMDAIVTGTGTQGLASFYTAGNVTITGGTGADSLALNERAAVVDAHKTATADIKHLGAISMSGGTGADVLTADFTASAAHALNAKASVHSIYSGISIGGGAGNDAVSVGLHANAGGPAFTAVVQTPTVPSYTTKTFTPATAHAKVTAISLGTASSPGITGGAGSDTIAVTLGADAMGAKTATAKVDFNSAHATGGASADSLSIMLHATATAGHAATALVASNHITVDGGTGNDSITVNLSAIANATGATGTPVATGKVTGNTIHINGGAGTDTISVNFAASQAISGNTVQVVGGPGADTIQFNLGSATASSGNSFVFVYNNTTELSSAAGDSISGLGLHAGDSVKFEFDKTAFTHNATSGTAHHLATSLFYRYTGTNPTAMASLTGDFWIYDTHNHSLYYANSGKGSTALLVAHLTSHVTLAASDIVFHTGTVA